MKNRLANNKHLVTFSLIILLSIAIGNIKFNSANANNEFNENFDNIKLNEAGSMEESSNSNWWLNSGGYLYSKNGIGRTFQKMVPKRNYWHKLYKKTNPMDTDNGYHPQNIFRLLTKGKWDNLSQQASFRINRNNLSKSKNRNESNGLLLFNRYQDEDNLYYTGIRVDGLAIIKKKILGKYFTMAQKKIYQRKYDRRKRPNLLPKHRWIGVKSEVVTNSDHSVTIKLFLSQNNDDVWDLVLTTTDNNHDFGGEAIKDAGYGGIRTDFMDVDFDNYKIEELK